MRIYSISKIAAIPFAILLVGLMYVVFNNTSSNLAYLLIFPVVVITILFVFNGQIDYWYLKRNPPTLDPPIKDWLLKYVSFYIQLDEEGKRKFEDRMSLYLFGRAFASVGSEHGTVPEDIKGVIAHIAVVMGFHDEDILIGDYDRVFLYKHPFPSPKMQFLHTAETDHEDGVFIFSLEHLIPPILNKESFYNIGFHAYAEAYLRVHQTKNWPLMNDVSWEGVQSIAGFSKKNISDTLGYEPNDFLPILINYHFHFKDRLDNIYPNISDKLSRAFS